MTALPNSENSRNTNNVNIMGPRGYTNNDIVRDIAPIRFETRRDSNGVNNVNRAMPDNQGNFRNNNLIKNMPRAG